MIRDQKNKEWAERKAARQKEWDEKEKLRLEELKRRRSEARAAISFASACGGAAARGGESRGAPTAIGVRAWPRQDRLRSVFLASPSYELSSS